MGAWAGAVVKPVYTKIFLGSKSSIKEIQVLRTSSSTHPQRNERSCSHG